MSHIVEAKTSIKNPDSALLSQAVELVAQQHSGGRVTDYYLSFSGQHQPARLSIITDDLHRGMGILVKKTGELTFKGDYWGRQTLAESLQQQILQTYVSLATMQSLRQMGYEASAEDGEEGQVILTGVNQYA